MTKMRDHLESIGACQEALDEFGSCTTLSEAWRKCDFSPRKWWYLVRTKRLTAFDIARKLIASKNVDDQSKRELRRLLQVKAALYDARLRYWELHNAVDATRDRDLAKAADCIHDFILLQLSTRELRDELQEWLEKDFAVLKSRRGEPPWI